MRTGTISVVILIMLFSAPGAAYAACEAPPDLESALRTTPVAFIGKVDQTDLATGETSMTVLWVWKGVDVPEQVLITPPRGTSADSDPGAVFTTDATYIVIPSNEMDPFEVAECSGTRRYRGDGAEIPTEFHGATGRSAPLPPGVSSLPTPETAGGFPWLALVGGLLLVVALGYILYRGRAKRAEDKVPRSRRRWLGGLAARGRSGTDRVRKLKRKSRR